MGQYSRNLWKQVQDLEEHLPQLFQDEFQKVVQQGLVYDVFETAMRVAVASIGACRMAWLPASDLCPEVLDHLADLPCTGENLFKDKIEEVVAQLKDYHKTLQQSSVSISDIQPSGLGQASSSELAFIVEPADVIAVRDRPLVLNCLLDGEPPIGVTWFKNGFPLVNDAHTSVLNNGSLRIESFHKRRGVNNETDVGEYHCAAQNRFGLLVSRKAKVLLASLPKFHLHPESMVVEEGGVARFQCLIHGVPEAVITWERNRITLQTDDYRLTLLPAGVLQITGVQHTDKGMYRCVASNTANTRYSQEAQLSIIVSAPKIYQEPVILSGPQNLTLTVHQTAILECIATGNPRPIVSWSRLDGRSIGVEGIQVLGTGNLMIADVSVKHSGVYVCAANRPGTRVRRTAQGMLMVQAPPEFVQWPQSISKPPGNSAIFTCVAQGVPEPHLIWLKNGKILTPGENVKLSNNNSTLMIQHITSTDEAIYQCIAENTAGTNQASARLAVALSKELPRSPEGITAIPVSTTDIQVTWTVPSLEVTEGIIGYVLHIRKAGEPDSRELQEAVSKTTFKHVFTNLEPSTTYAIYLKAYSPLGASKDSEVILATTMGSAPAPLGFFTKVINSTAVQAFWELPQNPGKIEGFKLFYRKIPVTHFEGPLVLLSTANSHVFTDLETSETYEIKLQAFNGNGEGNSTVRFVSLKENAEKLDAHPVCHCNQEGETSLAGIVVGIHIGMACIIFCVLFLMFGYRKSLFCKKVTQDSWTVPQGTEATRGSSEEARQSVRSQRGKKQNCGKPPEMVELVTQSRPYSEEEDQSRFQVTVQQHPSS
ncbi:immunoglobulin superfamily DCC subclass member 3-like [Rhinatrema bivittatum]|uniref:immunoglobulin superfamily DCC subclass member 3-like n=1 Tax=Rhinatrema bivittatum TaxID=194408 RepID=UPI00112D6109|nr:immunoglobulin superfamily DCC subclass member 3-like [Rhinatrema bivittatum]